MSRIEIIGDATLYLGDCMDILPTLGKVDAVVTDPPYGIADKWRNEIKLKNGKSRLWVGKNEWDNRPAEREIQYILDNFRDVIFWGANYYTIPPSDGFLVWDKMQKSLGADCEIAFFNNAKTTKIFRLSRAEAFGFNHQFESAKTELKEHPTQKPLSLMKWCLGFIPDAETILDPFMGSGTTGVAALDLGRKFIGVEKDEHYFNIACRRIDDSLKQGKLFT